MLKSTLAYLHCVSRDENGDLCKGALTLYSKAKNIEQNEIHTGYLECQSCEREFPILAGVAILVDDLESYFYSHAKGIAKLVSEEDIPEDYLPIYLDALNDLENAEEHIESDLESERVTALYLMTHYLQTDSDPKKWWKPDSNSDEGSPLIDELIQKYWDKGPFFEIEKYLNSSLSNSKPKRVVELGCGVGGLYRRIEKVIDQYLGVDSSFASIALARHILLGAKYTGKLAIPSDLLNGPLSKKLDIPISNSNSGSVDFIVAELSESPLQPNQFDVSIALNMTDMLEAPEALPAIQFDITVPNGITIQSCPYIWHAQVAAHLKNLISENECNSAKAIETLYDRAGFQIEASISHLPWLFLKHSRQLEIYSVHLFFARRGEA